MLRYIQLFDKNKEIFRGKSHHLFISDIFTFSAV
jgi:hypothetical protein